VQPEIWDFPQKFETRGHPTTRPPDPHLHHRQQQRLFLDASFGCGGHTRALLERDPSCKVIAIDCDRTAFEGAAAQRQLIEHYKGRLLPIQAQLGVAHVDGILIDLGVSSPQLDTSLSARNWTAHWTCAWTNRRAV